MATAQEKEAKQQVRDIAKSSIVQGQQRLATVGRAGSAFPERRLRSSGDLSRYAIGGFLSDALPPVPAPVVKPVPKVKPAPPPRATTTRRKPVATVQRVAGAARSAPRPGTVAPSTQRVAGIARSAPRPGTVAPPAASWDTNSENTRIRQLAAAIAPVRRSQK